MSLLLERLRREDPALGCFSFLPSVETVEILGLAGFDFTIIDREHSPKDWSCVGHMIRAAQVRGMSAPVRVSRNDPAEILTALDLGADGIVVPGVATPEDAAAARRAMRFAPDGSRGACPLVRAASYGALDYPAFQRDEARAPALMVLIETAAGIDRIEAIAQAAGRDTLYMLGRSDLAAEMGYFGQPTHPAVVEAADRFLQRLRQACPDAWVGMGLYSASEAGSWHAKGCRFFWFGADVSIFMQAGKAAVGAMRAACQSNPRARRN